MKRSVALCRIASYIRSEYFLSFHCSHSSQALVMQLCNKQSGQGQLLRHPPLSRVSPIVSGTTLSHFPPSRLSVTFPDAS